MTTEDPNNYKVRLISVSSLSGGGAPEQVLLNVTPRFTESREVEYTSLTPVHLPGNIQVFKNTRSRTFSIGAHFISRTVEEATTNMIYLQTLRGWTLPYFGATSTVEKNGASGLTTASNNQKSATAMALLTSAVADRTLTANEANLVAQQSKNSEISVELLGAPPDVLYLYAYSSGNNSGKGGYGASRPSTYGVNINKIPVVITSLSIVYPDDVDYIPTYSNKDPRISEPFPIKMDVDISLVETHSPREYEQFDLLKFKRGVLVNF